MQKKNSKNGHRENRKHATKRVPPTLRARALAIINSDAYDEDTRASIKFQLTTNYTGLVDMVTRAEQGETICDTYMVSAEQRNAARKVIALFETKGVPDFLTDAMLVALESAGAIKNVSLWKPDGNAEQFNPAAVAHLFALTPMLSLRPKEGIAADRQRVIDATAEILRNPQSPADLFNAVAEFVTEAINKENRKDGQPGEPEFFHTVPILSLILDSYPEDELRAAVIAARKAEQ